MKTSLWIKTMCFILAPVLIFTFICSLIYIVYTVQNPDYKSIIENDNYFESKIFSDYYKNDLVSVLANTYDNNYFAQEINGINYITLQRNSKNFNYLLIDKKTNSIYTNLDPTVKTDTVDKIKSEIFNNSYYWHYNNNIDTNIENLKTENLSFTDYIYESVNNNDFEIYSSVNKELKYNDNFVFGKILFNIINKMGSLPILLILTVSLILIILICSYLILSLGHKKGYNGIYLNYLDILPLEVILALLFFVGGTFSLIGFSIPALMGSIFSIIGIILFCVNLYICFAIAISTIIKRIKSGTLFKNTLIFRILKWLKKLLTKFKNWINKTIDLLFTNTNSSFKLATIYFGFIACSALLLVFTFNSIFVLTVPALWIFIFMLLLKKINNFYTIKSAVHDIYEGKNDIKLNETEFSGDLIELASDVNDIAGGFSNAIEESLKSERLKTELITNVSHDIKTPLTSIISYIDLLKQENIDNEKAKEYIEVLDNKSQRLKRLIEDLVEASKASSGNIKLDKEHLNVSELINQCIGEFEDKFKTKKLEIVSTMPKENVHIYADSRYMFRVIENIFSNITKYALDNSRVYIDVSKTNEKINISIKNISKDKLNISPDELMERFVRGDKSRFTEGSGLGLSISKSLTELQSGDFKISIDGDLFKVDLSFNVVK